MVGASRILRPRDARSWRGCPLCSVLLLRGHHSARCLLEGACKGVLRGVWTEKSSRVRCVKGCRVDEAVN